MNWAWKKNEAGLATTLTSDESQGFSVALGGEAIKVLRYGPNTGGDRHKEGHVHT
jgi:hypothetical protein